HNGLIVLESAPAGISLHNFCGARGEQLVHFHASGLRDSPLPLGGGGAPLRSLAVGMCSPHVVVPDPPRLIKSTFRCEAVPSLHLPCCI
uniref:Uncharacterized protein n=1 Tax=Chelonoidis abingdonii TaxID=106734 RepID=A0A8C0J6T0_CHEAB